VGTVPLAERSLIFVTGKGGVGKTSVAAGLAQMLSAEGRSVLACEVDAKGDLAAAFEASPAGFQPSAVTENLSLMSMDTEASLREYLRLNLKIPVVGRIGPLARAFDFVATAAPGVKEILTVGKLCYEVRERHYDTVVVDASATGHIIGQLAAPQAINELVKVGLIRSQTGWMLEILSDPARCGLVIVTTPEEMPVAETIELRHAVAKKTTVDLAAVVVNRVLPERFSPRTEEVFEQLDTERGIAVLEGLFGEGASSLLAAASLATALRRNRTQHLARLRAGLDPETPVLLVPYLFQRADGLRATHQVALHLAEELDR
jgi:anion-transporting  ArsA/GET3 family ATPase